MSTRIRLIVLLVLVAASSSLPAEAGSGWFVSFERVQVAPVERSNTSQLVEAGTIDTDGFSELVFSLAGEFKEGVPAQGTVGALLIPNQPVFDFLLRNEGRILFPLEAMVRVGGGGAIFVSKEQTARVAFPSYRVFFYNETTSGATVSLFVYRTK